MPRPGIIHQPARAPAVELCIRRDRHDHVDFAAGMAMMVADQIGDVDHVHAESMRRLAGLEYAAEAPLGIALAAQPARGDAGVTRLLDPAEYLALRGKFLIEIQLQGRIE